MRKRSALLATVLATLVSGSALAGLTTTLDGITFPVGLVPGGNQIDSSLIGENQITGNNQQLLAIGRVDSINDDTLTPTWQNGNNNVELIYTLTGYTSNSFNNGAANFTGGVIGFWVVAAGTSLTSQSSLALDISHIQTIGTNFLQLSGVPLDTLGDTLVQAITAAGTYAGTQSGDWNVTGGAAAADFATHTFSTAIGNASDLTFTNDFSLGSCPAGVTNISVCGSATIKANAALASEPGQAGLGILGIGAALLVLGRSYRRGYNIALSA